MPNDASFLEIPCDVLIPAAIAGTIDGPMAERLQCKAVIEAANGALTFEADKVCVCVCARLEREANIAA